MIESNKNFKLINQAFPHIGKRLRLFWGQPEFSDYIEGLQTNAGDSSRAGFPGDILVAISSLALAHDAAYPQLMHTSSNIWAYQPSAF